VTAELIAPQEDGVNKFLAKPFSPSKLATRLQQLTEPTAR
jgi:CheY-like chemotaxis protein